MKAEKTREELKPYYTGEAVPVEFHPSPSDSSKCIVSGFMPGGKKEVIGHIKMEITGGDPPIIYACFDAKGKPRFLPTDNFNEVEKYFQKYAQKLVAERATEMNLKALAEKRKDELEQFRQNKAKERKTEIER